MAQGSNAPLPPETPGSGKTSAPDKKSSRGKTRLLASACIAAGLVMALLELMNLLHPRPELPESSGFWLAVGAVTAVLGILELVLDGRDLGTGGRR